ncbi:hypothetical protein J6590_108002, partial [Homalodisca vitripennis]
VSNVPKALFQPAVVSRLAVSRICKSFVHGHVFKTLLNPHLPQALRCKNCIIIVLSYYFHEGNKVIQTVELLKILISSPVTLSSTSLSVMFRT